MGTRVPEARCSRKFSVWRSPAPVMYPATESAATLAAKLARVARNSSGPPALRSSASLQASNTITPPVSQLATFSPSKALIVLGWLFREKLLNAALR